MFADSGGDAAPPAVAAGSRLAMVITHCDENGHPLAQGGAAPTVLGVEFGGAGRALPAFPVDDRLDGTYSVRVRLKEAGLWQLHARWGGSALPGSPSQLRVLPGAVHAPSCALAPEPVASRWAAAYAVSGRVGGADACAAGTGREDARGVGGGGRGGGEKKDEEDDDEGCVTAAVGETVRLALLLRDRFGNAVPFEAKEWKEDEEGAIHGRIAMRSRSSEDEDEDEGEVVSVELEQVGDAVGDCGNVVLRRSTASPPAQWQRLCVPLEATPRAPGLFRARAWVQGRRGGYEAVPGGVSLRVDAGAVSPAATRVLLSAAPRPEERSPPLHPSSCGVAVAAGSAAVLAVHLHDARGNAINGSAALLALRAVSSSPAALSASVHAPDDAAAWPRAAWAVRAPSGSGDKAGQPPASPTDASALYAGASALVRLFGTGAGAGHSVRLFVGGESVGAISCTVRTGPPSGLRSEVVGVLARNGAAPLEQADPCARGSDGVWRALLPSGPRPALAITALLSVRDDWGNALDDAQALRAVRAAVGRVRARESAEEARAAAASWAAGATPAGTGGVDRDERPPPTGPTLRSIGAADGVQVPGVTLPHQGTVAAEVRVSTGCRLSLAVSVDGESLLEGDIEVETRHSGAVVADARAAARMVAAEARRARAKQAEEEEAARARAAEDKVQRVQRARVEAERRREETRRRLEARNAQRRLMAQLRRVESERREEEARRGRKEEEEARAARVAAARQVCARVREGERENMYERVCVCVYVRVCVCMRGYWWKLPRLLTPAPAIPAPAGRQTHGGRLHGGARGRTSEAAERGPLRNERGERAALQALRALCAGWLLRAAA